MKSLLFERIVQAAVDRRVTNLEPDERDVLEFLLNDPPEKSNDFYSIIEKHADKDLIVFRQAVKYLIFDLEATRRENAYLRKMLEEIGNGNKGDGS